jgi:hypothetical protein
MRIRSNVNQGRAALCLVLAGTFLADRSWLQCIAFGAILMVLGGARPAAAKPEESTPIVAYLAEGTAWQDGPSEEATAWIRSQKTVHLLQQPCGEYRVSDDALHVGRLRALKPLLRWTRGE